MKIFGWAADSAGCAYYRLKLPMQKLQDNGFNAWTDVRMPDHYPSDMDITIVGQRVCNPAPSSMWKAMHDAGKRLIYEIDDDLFNVDRSSTSAYHFFNLPEIKENLKRNISMADRVIASTEPLAELMRKYNDDVVVCPNTIPNWLLKEQPFRRKEKVTIGWGGSPTHEMDFEQVRNELRRIIDRHDNVELHVIGTNYASWMKLPRERCRFTPWIPDVPTFFRTIDYDIGIAPLKSHVFNRSKSHIKALECAALGIPIVASNVTPYRDFVRHGVTGFLVNRDHEWSQYLRDLINDEDMRIAMGNSARVLASQWTIEGNIDMWKKAYFD